MRKDFYRTDVVVKSVEEQLARCQKVSEERLKLLEGKAKDYGVETWQSNGLIGLFGDINGKFRRIKNIIYSDKDPNYESLRDSCIDLGNYADFMVVLMDAYLEADAKAEKHVHSFDIPTNLGEWYDCICGQRKFCGGE